MIDNPIVLHMIPILAGIVYGILFYFGKKYLLFAKNLILDFTFTVARIGLLLLFMYQLSNFTAGNSILLIVLFVSSYLSTIGILAYISVT